MQRHFQIDKILLYGMVGCRVFNKKASLLDDVRVAMTFSRLFVLVDTLETICLDILRKDVVFWRSRTVFLAPHALIDIKIDCLVKYSMGDSVKIEQYFCKYFTSRRCF